MNASTDASAAHIRICPTSALLTTLSVSVACAERFGYAIESALKGLWVRAGNKLIVNGKFTRPPNAGDHELGQLARVASKQVHLPLIEDELNVLDRLSAFVIFAGRYPVALRPDDMQEKKTPDGGKQVTFFSDEDFQITRRLLNGFTTALNPHINMFKLANRNP